MAKPTGIPVEILHVPLTSPCPVPVTPMGETMRDGEPIPMDERTELCAVDAAWMIGNQRVCDVHLRIFCEVSGIDFDGILDELGAGEYRREQSARPWADRERYDQVEARRWHEDALERGLA